MLSYNYNNYSRVLPLVHSLHFFLEVLGDHLPLKVLAFLACHEDPEDLWVRLDLSGQVVQVDQECQKLLDVLVCLEDPEMHY